MSPNAIFWGNDFIQRNRRKHWLWEDHHMPIFHAKTELNHEPKPFTVEFLDMADLLPTGLDQFSEGI